MVHHQRRSKEKSDSAFKDSNVKIRSTRDVFGLLLRKHHVKKSTSVKKKHLKDLKRSYERHVKLLNPNQKQLLHISSLFYKDKFKNEENKRS